MGGSFKLELGIGHVVRIKLRVGREREAKIGGTEIPGTLQMRRNIRPLSGRTEEEAFQKRQDVV